MSGVNHMISAEDINTLKENVNTLMDAKTHGWLGSVRHYSHATAPRNHCAFLELYDNLDPFLTTLLNILEKIDKPVSDIAENVSKEVVLDERIEEDYDDDL